MRLRTEVPWRNAPAHARPLAEANPAVFRKGPVADQFHSSPAAGVPITVPSRFAVHANVAQSFVSLGRGPCTRQNGNPKSAPVVRASPAGASSVQRRMSPSEKPLPKKWVANVEAVLPGSRPQSS